MADGTIGYGREIWSLLRKLVRELTARKAGGHLIESSLKDLHSPGRIDGEEAGHILKQVRALQTDLVQMVSELDGIIEEGA